jgi:hypothetical protein
MYGGGRGTGIEPSPRSPEYQEGLASEPRGGSLGTSTLGRTAYL